MQRATPGKSGGLLRGAAASVVSLATLTAWNLSAPRSNADVYIRTIPEQTEWVADGTTEYRVDVVGDTTEEIDKEFVSAGWSVWIPANLNYVRAELPDNINNPSQNPDDFFFNHVMESDPGGFFNTVYSPPVANNVGGNPNPTWPERINANIRETLSPSLGPTNNDNKLLGSYYFTVSASAAQTPRNFLTSNEEFVDTNGIGYDAACSGGGCLIREHFPFTIVAPEIPGDLNMDGAVDILDVPLYADSALDPVTYSAQRAAGTIGQADMNDDGELDATDTQGFVDALTGR